MGHKERLDRPNREKIANILGKHDIEHYHRIIPRNCYLEIADLILVLMPDEKEIKRAVAEEIKRELEKLCADSEATITFIRKRDGKAGVEICKIIIVSDWHTFWERY